VLLGDDHPFVLSYGRFVRSYSAREYSYQNKLRSLQTVAPPSALLLRYVQLRTVTFWRKDLNYRELPRIPDFEEVLEKLDLHDTSWIPTIPKKYWAPLGREPGSTVPSTISELSAPVSAGTGLSSGGTSGTPASGPPSGASAAGVSEERSQQTPARNPAVSDRFSQFAERIRGDTVRNAISHAEQPPLVTRFGRSIRMCLSYHLKGCWSGCGRHEDHGPHSEAEDTDLFNWCAYALPWTI